MIFKYPQLLDKFKSKILFAFSSLLATGVDYSVFLFLVWNAFTPVNAHYISASIGMMVNFIVHNKFVFDRSRKLYIAFIMSTLVSVLGIVIGGQFLLLLQNFTILNAHPYLAKIIVSGLIFFYNFYLKRFAFEKRLV